MTPQLTQRELSLHRRLWKNELVKGTDAYKKRTYCVTWNTRQYGIQQRAESTRWISCCRIWKGHCCNNNFEKPDSWKEESGIFSWCGFRGLEWGGKELWRALERECYRLAKDKESDKMEGRIVWCKCGK